MEKFKYKIIDCKSIKNFFGKIYYSDISSTKNDWFSTLENFFFVLYILQKFIWQFLFGVIKIVELSETIFSK